MGVGRETTAIALRCLPSAKAYTMGVGRETTAALANNSATLEAYTMGVGRETTALTSTATPSPPSLHDGSR